MRPSDTKWRQRSWTALAQVMACCLAAPGHNLNQRWLIIRKSCRSHRGYFKRYPINKLITLKWKLFIEISINSSRPQWVNQHPLYERSVNGSKPTVSWRRQTWQQRPCGQKLPTPSAWQGNELSEVPPTTGPSPSVSMALIRKVISNL